MTVILDSPGTSLKQRVRQHWQAETCGTRYSNSDTRGEFFKELARKRYVLEPDLKAFADFPAAAGKEVLEIGVGAGADFENWCRHARHATGVDLTQRAIDLTTERLQLGGVSTDRYSLRTADAENLEFDSDRFDMVYSWGVLHHTPNTQRAFQEVWRVLRPGGTLKAMIYHLPSWVGWMLKMNYGWARGNFRLSSRQAMFEHLESPGTKGYTLPEAGEFLSEVGFEEISLQTRLSAGDLLEIQPSAKHIGLKAKLIWNLYPRWLVRRLGHRYGLNLLIEAKKPR